MSAIDIIILGAGGHGMVVADTARAAGNKVLAFTDVDQELHGRQILDIPVICGDDILSAHDPASVHLVVGIGSTRDTAVRRRVFQDLKANGFTFATIIHPSAIVGREVSIGEGAVIMAGAIIQPRTHIAENVIVNTGAQVDHDGRIGAHCHIAPGAVLSGGARVGAGTHVGSGAVVVQGISIGADAVIAAGAVVIRDVPDGMAVAGNPARRIVR